MPPISDLVRDSRLETRFSARYTRHVYYVSGRTPRQRKVRREERWERGDSLGSGSFGTVWLETFTAEQADVRYRAVKEIRKSQRGSRAIDYSRELEAIAKFSHKKYELCFVKSYGWYENNNSVFIAMEYFPDGDLQSFMSSPLPETDVQLITSQVLEGLSFMHDNGYAHRDLKPSNILVRSKGPDWWVKLGDFGISKRAEEGLTALRTFNGTPGFLAPELLVQSGMLDYHGLDFGSEYTTAVDIWALGEIAFRALTAQVPFTRTLGPYIRGTSAFPTDILVSCEASERCREFIKYLMAPLPSDRPTAAKALEHDWMEPLRPSSPRSSLESDSFESLPEELGPIGTSGKVSANLVNPSWLDEASGCWSTVDGAAIGSTPPVKPSSPDEESVLLQSDHYEANLTTRTVESVSSNRSAATINKINTPSPDPSQSVDHLQPAKGGSRESRANRSRKGTPSPNLLQRTTVPPAEATFGNQDEYSVEDGKADNDDINATSKRLQHIRERSDWLNGPRDPRDRPTGPPLTPQFIKTEEKERRHLQRELGKGTSPIIADYGVEYVEERARLAEEEQNAFRDEFHQTSETKDVREKHTASDNRAGGQVLLQNVRRTNEPTPVANCLLPSTQWPQTYSDIRTPRTKVGDHSVMYTFREDDRFKVYHGRKGNGRGSSEAFIQHIPIHPGNRSEIYGGIQIIKDMSHPQIVRLKESLDRVESVCNIFEYIPGGNLVDYVLEKQGLPDREARRLFAQLKSALSYLHAKGIIHNDLTAPNLLLDWNNNIRLTVFHLAIPQDSKALKQTGLTGYDNWDLTVTRRRLNQYTAPEIFGQSGPYAGRKADIWSCGMILYLMVAGYLPFNGNSTDIDRMNIQLLFGSIASSPASLKFPQHVSHSVRDLIKRILVPDPFRRADFKEIATHIWLEEHQETLRQIIPEMGAQVNEGGCQSSLPTLLSLTIADVNQDMWWLKETQQLQGNHVEQSESQPLAHSQIIPSHPGTTRTKDQLLMMTEKVLREEYNSERKRQDFHALLQASHIHERTDIHDLFIRVYSQTKYINLASWEQNHLVSIFDSKAVPLSWPLTGRATVSHTTYDLHLQEVLDVDKGQIVFIYAKLSAWYHGEIMSNGHVERGLFDPHNVDIVLDREGSKERVDPQDRAIQPRRRNKPTLPPPQELDSRIQEARTSADLLIQMLETTSPKELLGSELIREFASRCSSAGMSLDLYMKCDDPSPNSLTMLQLRGARDLITTALLKNQQALYRASSERILMDQAAFIRAHAG